MGLIPCFCASIAWVQSSIALLWEVHKSKLPLYLRIMMSNSPIKIRCGQCNLPFLSDEQLQNHAVTHKRCKKFNCKYFQKGFTRWDHLKMHERRCEKDPGRKDSAQKYSTVIQVGGGVSNPYNLLEFTFGGVLQTFRWRAKTCLETVVKSNVYDLVIEASSTFKWYLGLKAIFHKAANSENIYEPTPLFWTGPFSSYHK